MCFNLKILQFYCVLLAVFLKKIKKRSPQLSDKKKKSDRTLNHIKKVYAKSYFWSWKSF